MVASLNAFAWICTEPLTTPFWFVMSAWSLGDVIVTNGLFEMAKVKKSDLKAGAVTDPSKLRGKIASEDVFPGDQLTTQKFEAGSGSIGSKITGYDRWGNGFTNWRDFSEYRIKRYAVGTFGSDAPGQF